MNPSNQDESERLGLVNHKKLLNTRQPELDNCWQQIADACFAAGSSVLVGILLVNQQLRCVQVNAVLAEFSGLPLEEHQGKLLRDVLPDLADALEKACQQVWETGQPIVDLEVESEWSLPSETRRYWTIACFPVAHTPIVSLFILETTSVKRLEHALHTTKGQSAQLAIAIQQSKLHQQIQHLNDELENQVAARTAELQIAFEFEATLKRITDRVRDSLDEDQILQAAVRELVLVLKISGCNASMYDLEQRTSTTCYEYTTSISPYQGRIAKFSAVPELYSQLLGGQYFQFCSLVPNPERGLVSMLACPIRDDQGVIGDLWLIHHKEYAFNQQDIRLVEQVANQCAIAIRQARLYEKSQAQVKELERLNQLKDDFLSTVSHELRTPLSNIKMAIHMLRAAPSLEKRERYMAILEAECGREIELINDLLDLQKLENDSYTVAIEPLDLKTWLPSVISPFASRAHTRQQRLTVELSDELPILMSDRKTLERILAELLNNACKYTPPQGTIALQVTHRSASATNAVSTTTFAVKNQANVSPTEIPRMFEKFYRIPKSDPWQQGGTGLGLALVKKLVETLQGNITATSADGWTTLQVDLPVLIGEYGE